MNYIYKIRINDVPCFIIINQLYALHYIMYLLFKYAQSLHIFLRADHREPTTSGICGFKHVRDRSTKDPSLSGSGQILVSTSGVDEEEQRGAGQRIIDYL